MKKQVIIGYASKDKIVELTDAYEFESNRFDKQRGIKILRWKRIYNLKPKNYFWKSPKKIVRYHKVKITIEKIG